jgi:hypothetical protein
MGLIGLTRTLAFELGHDGVTVNAALPGPVAGDRTEEVVAAQAAIADVEHAHPVSFGENDFAMPDYVVEPREVAEQAACLAGPHARHITAKELGVDAGGPTQSSALGRTPTTSVVGAWQNAHHVSHQRLAERPPRQSPALADRASSRPVSSPA